MKKAILKGERTALALLVDDMWEGLDGAKDRERAALLYRKATMLGDRSSQERYAELCCEVLSLEQWTWRRRAAMQYSALNDSSYASVLSLAIAQRWKIFEQLGVKRVLFEMGKTLETIKWWLDTPTGQLMWVQSSVRRLLEMYHLWCGAAS